MNIFPFSCNWFAYPHRIAAIRRYLRTSAPRVLDVGCGNHSPTVTKRYLPHCVYHGIDRPDWNRNGEDERNLDQLFALDLEGPGALDVVPDGQYDAVICSHLLEHLSDPYEVLQGLMRKVAPGGVLYVEVPSERSLSLPRAQEGWWGIRGCLNFSDDTSHRTMVDMDRVVNLLCEAGFCVGPSRYRRMWRRIILLPVYMIGAFVLKRFVPAAVVWDITGFAKYVVAVKADHRP